MSDPWLNFVAMFFVQLLLFFIHAYYENKLTDVPRILWWGAIGGIVFGPPCDLIFGKYLGLDSYTLGFGPLFIILNALFLYGLFAANTLLMKQARLLHFCVWTVIVTAVFEVVNLFLHLYTYSFAVPSIEYVIIAFVGPIGVAIAIAIAWHTLFKNRFVFITNAIKK